MNFKKLFLIAGIIGLILGLMITTSQSAVRTELLSKTNADSTFTVEAAILIETYDIPIESDTIQLGIETIMDNKVTINYITTPKFNGFIVFSTYFTHLKLGKHKFSIRICPTMLPQCKDGSVNFELTYSDINDIRPVYARMVDIYRGFDDTLEVELSGLADSITIFLDNKKLSDVDLRKTQYFVVDVTQLPSGKHILKAKSKNSEKNFEFIVPFSLLRLLKTDYKRSLEALAPLSETGSATQRRIFDEMRKKHEFSDSLFNEFWGNSNISYDDYQTLLFYANQTYACWKTPGWETDMGKTFLKLGPPDEIETYENGFESVIIWEYWQFNKKVYFVRKNNATCYEEDPFAQWIR